MATFAGQAFRFQNVKEEDVFPDISFMTTVVKFENFLRVFVENQSSNQELPQKLVAGKVITNSVIHDWISYQAPPVWSA